MDHTVRFIILALVIAVSLLRAIRRSSANRPQPDSTRETPGGATASRPTTAPNAGAAVSPIEADAGNSPNRFAAVLVAALVWLAGNVAVWLCLFELPALEAAPKSWRFAALVFANIVLTALARVAAARVRGLAVRPTPASSNPIGE
jgi:hypothetical protein